MRPVEHGAHSTQRHADTAAGPFADRSPGGSEQRFDLIPSEIGRGWLREDAGERPSVTFVHHKMISYIDINSRLIKE